VCLKFDEALSAALPKAVISCLFVTVRMLQLLLVLWFAFTNQWLQVLPDALFGVRYAFKP
jgi:hypothetical protein